MKYENMTKIGLIFAVFFVMAGFVAAQTPSPLIIKGRVLLQNSTPAASINVSITVTMPNGTQLAESGFTGGSTATTNSEGNYSKSATLPVGVAYVGTNITVSATVTTVTSSQSGSVPYPITSTPAGGVVTVTNLILAAGEPNCSDGIPNGDEAGIDCAGPTGTSNTSCTVKCFDLSLSLSSSSISVQPGSNGTLSATLTNRGKNNLANVVVTATVNNANVTFTFAGNNVSIAGSGSGTTAGTATATVNITVFVAENASRTTYTGSVNASDSTGNATASSTLSVVAGAAARHHRKGMTVTMKGLIDGQLSDKYCVGSPVVITVKDENTGEGLEGIDTDVYFGGHNGHKIENLLTDANGTAQFTPAIAGEYTVTIEESGYRTKEISIDVEACVPAVTTVETTVATTAPTTVATTVETTVATTAPTTVETTVATTAPTTVPTTIAALPAAPSTMWLWLLVIIIIVVAVVYAVKKKGGAAPKEAPRAKAKK